MATIAQLRNELRVVGMMARAHGDIVSVMYPVKLGEKCYTYKTAVMPKTLNAVRLFISDNSLQEAIDANS